MGALNLLDASRSTIVGVKSKESPHTFFKVRLTLRHFQKLQIQDVDYIKNFVVICESLGNELLVNPYKTNIGM